MLKKIAIALLCVGLGSTLYARDEISVGKGFVGLEVGYGMVQGDTWYELGHEGDNIEYGVRLGAENEEWRTMFVFDYFDSASDDQNVEKGFLMLDYFVYQSHTEINVKPFLGVNIGYANYESTGVDVSAFMYGGQIGVAFEVASQFEVDLAYRYSLSSEDEFDHTSSVTLGFNYLF